MGVRFVHSEGDVSGYTGPRFVCDTCGERIEGFDAAIVVFPTDAASREPTGEFLTVHKGREPDCDTTTTRRYPWQDLDQFLYELFVNAGLEWAEVEKRRARLREFGVTRG